MISAVNRGAIPPKEAFTLYKQVGTFAYGPVGLLLSFIIRWLTTRSISLELSDEDVGFTVEDAITLLNGSLTNRLSQVALARAWRTEEQGVFMSGNKVTGGEVEDETPVHLLVREVRSAGRQAEALKNFSCNGGWICAT
jgi:hypothetical protein